MIECKHWKKKVGLEVVRGFESKIRDIEAHHGMIVSERGYSKKALKFAEQHNISLCKPVDAQSKAWENVGIFPIQVTRVCIGKPCFKFSGSDEFGIADTIAKEIGTEAIVILDKKKNQSLNLRQLWQQKLDELISEKSWQIWEISKVLTRAVFC